MIVHGSGLPIRIEDLLSHRRIESDRIEFKEGWNPDPIYRSICAFANDFDNIGGPDRSIKLKDLQAGTAVSGRYRNRRLGDFLKEMDLTEGRSTGLSLIHRELSKNGSPPPLVETDDERTFFRIILPIHPAFEGNNEEVPVVTSNSALLVHRLKSALLTDDQAGNQASNQASNQAGNQAGNQADLENIEKMSMLLQALQTVDLKKDALLMVINLSVQAKNVQRYIDPLETAGLIEKTIPEKPTSPKQQYRLTVKGKALQKDLENKE